MDELITERTLICKLHGSFMRLAHLFDMLAMGVCATRHCQAAGRLVQELDVCTVHVYCHHFLPILPASVSFLLMSVDEVMMDCVLCCIVWAISRCLM